MDKIKDVKMLVTRDLLKVVLCAAVTACMMLQVCTAARVDVHSQCFEPGGWSLDPQFMDVMGSPYLLAHGLGVRVMDATARVDVPEVCRERARTWRRREGESRWRLFRTVRCSAATHLPKSACGAAAGTLDLAVRGRAPESAILRAADGRLTASGATESRSR